MPLPILFDKSFLQSLSVDESVWFDHFFIANVCPIFYVETLADLSKKVRKDRTPEKEVSIIAEKFPVIHSFPCAYHLTLAINNLIKFGEVPLNGQIPVAGGIPAKMGDETAVVFRESPEAQAFTRWQDGKFFELERMFAHKWRNELEALDLSAIKKALDKTGINSMGCKTFEDVRRIAGMVVSEQNKKFEAMNLAMIVLDVDPQTRYDIFGKWKIYGQPPLKKFAPYAAHVLEVEIFFHLAIAANLISPERASNRTDIAYLFYLPFCTIFVSSDKLHKHCASLFMREDQEFVWGLELKYDLEKLNRHYSITFSSEDKERGITKLVKRPPKDMEFLVTQLWERLLPFSDLSENSPETEQVPERYLNLMKEIEKNSSSSFSEDALVSETQNPDLVSFQRNWPKRKGSWWILPKDFEIPDG